LLNSHVASIKAKFTVYANPLQNATSYTYHGWITPKLSMLLHHDPEAWEHTKACERVVLVALFGVFLDTSTKGNVELVLIVYMELTHNMWTLWP
jgi:hypothetical protein